MVAGLPKPIPMVFYRTPADSEVVREWLRDQEPEPRGRIGRGLGRLQYGWPVGMPLCRSLGAGLWELRVDLGDGTTARLLFAFVQGAILVLHGFIKKTRATPPQDLELARARLREFVRNPK